jgi:HAD superfamily hydrolase (TIGR01509 family)
MTPRSPPPTLVCFDLGGVVIRICRTWAEACAAAGVPLRHNGAIEARVSAALERLRDRHERGQLEGRAWARSVSDCLAGLYTPREVMAIHDAWLLGEYAGVAALVDDLHARGLATAALSNTNREHWAALDRFGAVRRLRHRVVSHEVGSCKPEPAIYHALEARTGARGPQIAFFDDRPENVAAAATLGWRSLHIDPGGETAPQIAAALRGFGIEVESPLPSPAAPAV